MAEKMITKEFDKWGSSKIAQEQQKQVKSYWLRFKRFFRRKRAN